MVDGVSIKESRSAFCYDKWMLQRQPGNVPETFVAIEGLSIHDYIS